MEIESIIQFLYEQVQMRKRTSPEFKKLSKVYSNKKEEFQKALNQEQIIKLDELLTLKGDTDIQEMKEYFEQGFIFATKLMAEVFNTETVDLSEF